MAESSESVATVLGEISRDHLECSICQDRYDTPKILNCLHSFCEKCLLDYQKTLQEPSVIKCPTCRSNSELPSDGIPGLKTNFHLKEIVREFALKEKLTQKEGSKLLCELCEDQWEAKSRCMDCPLFLCSKCLVAHRRIAADHEVLTLDTLRCGSGANTNSKIEPPCGKHRGEKKRFFCETCDELICRDCTVVEHRQHKFTTVEDAASRFRETTKQLVEDVGEYLSAVLCTVNDKSQIGNLDTCTSLSQDQVIKRAALESSKISQLESNILHDMSCREDLRLRTINANGYTATEPSPAPGKNLYQPFENKQKYCQQTEEMFKNIDSSLQVLNQLFDQIRKISSQLDNLRANAHKEAVRELAKVEARKEKLLMQIGTISDVRKNMDKITSTHIHRLHHALETAGDLVKSASDVDFLGLHSVIDADLRSLIKETPLIHPGYPEIEFKSRDGTGLGNVIGVPGATWKMLREIIPKSDKVDQVNMQRHSFRDDRYMYGGYEEQVFLDDRYGEYEEQFLQYGSGIVSQITIISMDAFKNDEILVGCRNNSAVLVYNTAGTRKREPTSRYTADRITTLPDGSFITVQTGGTAFLFPSNATSTPARNFHLSASISIASYPDKQIVSGYNNPKQKVTIWKLSGFSVVDEVPVSIQPDFLSSTSTGRILVCARRPAMVHGFIRKGTLILAIHPTVEEAQDKEQVSCGGICRDSRDYIYVAVSRVDHGAVHVHQYTPYGSFIGCLTRDIQPPIAGIAVTGDDTLVVAEQYKLKLFQLDPDY